MIETIWNWILKCATAFGLMWLMLTFLLLTYIVVGLFIKWINKNCDSRKDKKEGKGQ